MIPANTAEWMKARTGCLTGSRMGDAMARTKEKTALHIVSPDGGLLEKLGNGKTAEKKAEAARGRGLIVRQAVYEPASDLAPRRHLIREVAYERLSGNAVGHYVTAAMEDGIEREPAGKKLYEVRTGNILLPAGFVYHPTIASFGATPDALLDDDGCFELKCPTEGTHMDWLLGGVVPEEYKPQMCAEILCTDRKWCEFASFHPWFPPELMLFVQRYEPTEEEKAAVEAAAVEFLSDVESIVAALRLRAA